MNRRDFMKGLGKAGLGAILLKFLPQEAALPVAAPAVLPAVSVPFSHGFGTGNPPVTITTTADGRVSQWYLQSEGMALDKMLNTSRRETEMLVNGLSVSMDVRYVRRT